MIHLGDTLEIAIMCAIAFNVKLCESCGYLTLSDVNTDNTQKVVELHQIEECFPMARVCISQESYRGETYRNIFVTHRCQLRSDSYRCSVLPILPPSPSQNRRVLIRFDRITCMAYGPVAVFLYATQRQTIQK